MNINITISSDGSAFSQQHGAVFEIELKKGASFATIQCPECDGLGGSGGWDEPHEDCYWCDGKGVLPAAKHFLGRLRRWWYEDVIPTRLQEWWVYWRYDKPRYLKSWLFGPYVEICSCCLSGGHENRNCRRGGHYTVEGEAGREYACWRGRHFPINSYNGEGCYHDAKRL